MKPAALAPMLHELADRLANDRDTIGELAAAVNRHERELDALRDAIHELAVQVAGIARTLDARTERAA